MLSYSVEEPSLPRKLVSIFPRWLGKDNVELLDCKDTEERQSRDEKLLSHWAKVFDHTRVFRLIDGKLRQETDRELFLAACRNRPDKTSEEFAFVFLPDLRVYYKEDWDDTNVAWFSDEAIAQPLFDWAGECGLHILDEWRNAKPQSG